MIKNKRIAVVGLGVIGASLVGALGKQIKDIYPIDRDEAVIATGVRKGLFEKGYAVRALHEADIILLAIYPDSMLPFLKQQREYLRDGQLIIDVGGIKEKITAPIQQWLEEEGLDIEFLGAHPMAGTHGQGIEKAYDELFLGTRFLITPTEKNTEAGIQTGKEIGEILGVRKIYTLTPKEHDQLIAYTSQLPHLIAVALMNSYQDGSEKLLGGSFRDATRVADINEDLWTELFLLNKEALLESLDDYLKNLEKLRQGIVEEDSQKIREQLRQAKKKKGEIN